MRIGYFLSCDEYAPHQLLDEPVARESTAKSVLAGNDPQAHLAQISSYAEAGYDELYIDNMGPNYLQMIEFYGSEILPSLTSGAPS